MFKLVLLLLTLSGLRAVPVGGPGGLQRTSSTYKLPDGFEQGTEPSGLVEEDIALFQPSLGNGFGEMDRRQWFTDDIPDDVPVQKSGGGWVRVEEPSAPQLPDGFRQGTEPSSSIPDGFRQGTEPMKSASDSLTLVVEPLMSIPAGFRQGTEPSFHIPEGFKQGTEPSLHIPDGFRQGTERSSSIPDGFRQGTEPSSSIPDGFRQGTEPSTSRVQTPIIACNGEAISGNCYEFNPTPMAFQEAQVLCRSVAPNAELASVTSGDLHVRLVSLVTKGGENKPLLTWLGGTIKNQQASWVDGSEWSYSDWKPGHPNIHTDKSVCLEMFNTDERWWTAADCELKRASICSYLLH